MVSMVDLGDDVSDPHLFSLSVCLSVPLLMVFERGRRQQMELEMDMTPTCSAHSAWFKET